MRILDTIRSQDNATKYVVEYDDGLVGEATYINYPNKDIVCVPTQVACKMGCKFCHLTNRPDLVTRNLTAREMEDLVNIATLVDFRKPLLVSFMGSGEPLLNTTNMVAAMINMRDTYGDENVRFAFATMIPLGLSKEMLYLADTVSKERLRVKAHLSLHFTDDETRERYMPNAEDIDKSLYALEAYRYWSGQEVEIHYTLIDGVNDGPKGVADLARLIHPKIGIKVLHYSENPKLTDKRGDPLEMSECPNEFVYRLKEMGYNAEYYKPNGLDIGSSCGQFNLDRYVRKTEIYT
jgi:adenine C2-methylase RlmN of 23S rRNA A2503 and tRNA A37